MNEDSVVSILEDDIGSLRDPLLVAVFVRRNGFNSTASAALARYAHQHGATRLAAIDAQPFFDFTVLPPSVRIDATDRVIDWPRNDVQLVRNESASRDLLAISGIEPHLAWRPFAEALLGLIERYEVKTAVVLRSWPAQVPHTRPTVMRLTTDSESLAARAQLERRERAYQGPVDFAGLFQAMVANAGIENASLTAVVPNYLGVVPNPMAVVAFTEVLDRFLGTTTDLDEVLRAVEELRDRADEAVAQSDELREAVDAMEDNYSQIVQELGAGSLQESDLPNADELLRDVERFLRSGED